MKSNIDYPKFSVLMSLYIKEKAEYLDECIISILKQTVKPSEIVIVFDGPLTDDLINCVKKYELLYPGLIKTVKNKKNKGLGLALADGIPVCKYDLIARMDTDDIARIDRFELQLQEFVKDKNLDICGGQIVEFEGNIKNQLTQRRVPLKHNDIIEYQKKRSAFNHMTVMYKKQSILNAGNYQDAPLMEDDLMWVNLIISGAKCLNIDENLVYARTGKDMYKRRGGFKYFIKYKNSRKKIYKLGFISYWNYLITNIIQFIFAMIPNNLRGFLYKKILRKE